VKFFLQVGALVNRVDASGESIIDSAISGDRAGNDKLGLIYVLEKHGGLVTSSGVFHALQAKDDALFSAALGLLQKSSGDQAFKSVGLKAMLKAVALDWPEGVQTLIKKGIRGEAIDNEAGKSPLELAREMVDLSRRTDILKILAS